MSQVFITDGQTGEALTHIRYRNVLSNSHKKSLEDNSETFDFTTHADKPFSKFIDGNNRVIIPGEDDNFLEFIIYEVQEDRIEKELEIYSYASYAELITAKSISPHTTSALSAEAHGNLALAGTEWEIGNVEFKGVRTIAFENYTNPYAYLKRIASEFDLELDFRIEHDNGNITGRYVDLVEKVGQWRGRRVEFGKDLIGLKRIVNTENIVTALRVIGPIREDGSRLEVIVEDMDALARWGRNGRHKIKEYEPQFDDPENATIARLRELGEQELAKRVNAIVSYEGTIADLENVPGMENKKIRFGDTIQIKDTSYEPALYLDARIFFQDRDIKEQAEKIVYLGDFIEYTEEEVHSNWAQLQSQVAAIVRNEVPKVTYTKPEVDQKVSDVVDDAEKAAVEVVDSIEIGGRNIASVDSVATSGVTRDGYTYIIAKTGSSNPFMRIPTSRFEENKRYVISFKVKKISGNVTSLAGHDQSFRGMPVEIYRDGVKIEDVTTWSVGDQNYPNDNEVHEYEIHLKTPETFPSGDSAPYWYIQPNRPNYGENYELELWNFQIEQATKKSNWERPQDDVDKDIKEAKDEAEEAKLVAQNAMSTADGKNTVYRQSSTPPTTNRKIGDLWFKTDEGNKMFVWTGSWTENKLDYQALAVGNLSAISADLGDVTAGNIYGVRIEGSELIAYSQQYGTITIKDGFIRAVSKDNTNTYTEVEINSHLIGIWDTNDGGATFTKGSHMEPGVIYLSDSGFSSEIKQDAAWMLVESENVQFLSSQVRIGENLVDSIVSQGSNSNGNYIRYANGIQICWRKWTWSSLPITTALGALYQSATITWNFPALFIDNDVTVNSSVHRYGGLWTLSGNTAVSSNSSTMRVAAATSGTYSNVELSLKAIGRWK